eukprot:11103568-Ditylum_brightwellii.AAC.1
MGTDPERTESENYSDNEELDEDDGDIVKIKRHQHSKISCTPVLYLQIKFSNERDLSWYLMTLVQKDALDLVREYCQAKSLSMDGSTQN